MRDRNKLTFAILDKEGKVIPYRGLQHNHARKVFKTNPGDDGFSAPFNINLEWGGNSWAEVFNRPKEYGTRRGGCWETLRCDITKHLNEGDSIEDIGEVEFYDCIYFTMMTWLKGHWDLIDYFEEKKYSIRNRNSSND